MHSLTATWVGYASIICFCMAYTLVIFEEQIHMRKSKPVILIGCFMWALIGIYEAQHGGGHAHDHVKELIAEIGELFFFLLVAMTYINTLDERNVFKALRAWLLKKGLGFKKLFWATGGITFLLSPLADNLTSALLMSTVALAVSNGNGRFIVPAFVNIVVAANAGGAWSPFGDITTLMVWTSGKVQTMEFSHLILPSIVNWIVPASIMYFAVPDEHPEPDKEEIELKPGAKVIIGLGIFTVATAVSFHQFLHLPPFLGMMFGLGLLMMKGFYLKRWGEQKHLEKMGIPEERRNRPRFDIFAKVEGVEFDTLLFFFGVLTAVGALQYIGYLALASESMYGTLGPTYSNIIIGVLSAIVDNIPVMYAVLKMSPEMGLDQWLLITLTCGVGGSLLSVGSAAGVAVMGVDRKYYTFMSHLKWAPVIALGYIASIICWYFVTPH
ncbi:MAG: sodium:proton antiporter NhaD [Nitrospina sp.]|jgi:Na+/H+ antiporter NhaD/arsenite permease-like protein|nr:sodium:proton antiporter NhaD [Nitrospina sp.]MBT3414771.1 sodium:proton antiporter NhaD [Nitrospina sp.]MBT4104130.1 sodium:proton antiporter NhaD [Nitrospina sp.]MBT4388317.1 sodium:proton antiporter NhaD [Nitrospina sp.]MBT4621264.1 sodium:proton antiporter NhaD [Nitrospina sp.]